MPGAHGHGDARACGATTIVTGQSSVFFDKKLWAVVGDTNSHGGGALIQTGQTVFAQGKKVIVNYSDSASADNLCPTLGGAHCSPKTAYGSFGTFAYGPGGSGGIVIQPAGGGSELREDGGAALREDGGLDLREGVAPFVFLFAGASSLIVDTTILHGIVEWQASARLAVGSSVAVNARPNRWQANTLLTASSSFVVNATIIRAGGFVLIEVGGAALREDAGASLREDGGLDLREGGVKLAGASSLTVNATARVQWQASARLAAGSSVSVNAQPNRWQANTLLTVGSGLAVDATIIREAQLLLHCDGADASTTFTDSSRSAHTVTVHGDAQIDTTQSKFSGASALFDGGGDYLSLDGSSDFAFGTGDFTIDLWLRLNSTAASGALYNYYNGIWPCFYFYNGDHKLYYTINSVDRINGATALSAGVWYHVAVTRSSGSTRMFLDGVQEGSTYTDTNDYTNPANLPEFGGSANGLGLNGWIDEIRVIKGQAIWTSNFTPPSSPYG